MLIYLDGNQIDSLQVIDETPGRLRVVYPLLFQSLYLQLEVRILVYSYPYLCRHLVGRGQLPSHTSNEKEIFQSSRND